MCPTNQKVKGDIEILRHGFPHPEGEKRIDRQIGKAEEILSEETGRGCTWDV